LDDNFETIAAAVEEGRQILGNIRKVLVYLLSNVLDGLLLIGGALVVGAALPLNALQILWVNFFSDSFPAVAFAFEKGIDGFGGRPDDPRKGLFNPEMKFLIIGIGLITSAMLFGLYWFLLRGGVQEDLARTFIFACFGTYTLFLAFSVRSLEKSILKYSFFSNHYMIGAAAIGVALMAAAVYIPFLQELFGTVPLAWGWAAGVGVVGIVNIALVEFGKWVFRRKMSAAAAPNN
jgi:Ca2+-transporting ATPase